MHRPTDAVLEHRLDALVDALPLEAKVRLFTEEHPSSTHDEPAVGLRRMDFAGLQRSSPPAAAVFDEDLVRRIGAEAAAEARGNQHHAVPGPPANGWRSGLFTEDPYHAGRLGAAFTAGVQEHGVAACPQFHLAHDARAEGDATGADDQERALHEVGLAALEHVVERARPWMLAMVPGTGGAPAEEEGFLLDSVLRGEWGFDGLVLHEGAKSQSATAPRASVADLLPRPDGAISRALIRAVRHGGISQKTVDEKIRRILRLAGRVGALDGQGPCALPTLSAAPALHRESAAAGTVLLRNSDGLLPFDPESVSRLAVIDAHGDSMPPGLTWLLNRSGIDVLVPTDDAHAVELASSSDATVLLAGPRVPAAGEESPGPGVCLPPDQEELIRAVVAANPDTAVVVNSVRPVLTHHAHRARALLAAGFSAPGFGHALGEVLLGLREPGGRLPTTWAHPDTGTPRTGGLHVGHRAWLRSGVRPAYWFGAGQGYTTWRHDNLSVVSVRGADPTVRVEVTNTGGRRGREVVQVYLSRPLSAVDRPVRWYAGSAVVEAGPGAMATAEIVIPRRLFMHWSPVDDGWTIEPGFFTVHAARHAGDSTLTVGVQLH
jgi:beta-glucosidase